MSEILLHPSFGVYRPVTAESAVALGRLAAVVSERTAGYLLSQGNTTPVEAREDFGVTYTGIRDVEDALSDADSFSFAALIDGIEACAAQETEGLEVVVYEARRPKSRVGGLRLRFPPKDPGRLELQKQAELVRERFVRAGLPVGVRKIDHLTIVSLGRKGERTPLTSEQCGKIQEITQKAKRELGVCSVRFDGLVIGDDYRKPLSVAEWPLRD